MCVHGECVCVVVWCVYVCVCVSMMKVFEGQGIV